MSERPLTERMLGVLRVLDANRDRYGPQQMTPNEIGHRLGFTHGMHGDRYSHNGKRMGAANRVNFALTALVRRGLIAWCPRRDGLSGTAYYITDEGVRALEESSPARPS